MIKQRLKEDMIDTIQYKTQHTQYGEGSVDDECSHTDLATAQLQIRHWHILNLNPENTKSQSSNELFRI